ncbi:MAG: outer membrane beta-barrel protein [Tenacibaculum sp.]|nr:outer membrane beta-barrel protein [Tenacibaculum sp.]
MKKLILLVAVVFSSVAFSQRIQEGGIQANAGLGFSNGWGVPVYVGADYAITNDITIGAQLSYSTSTTKYSTYKWKGTWLGFGINGNYHFNELLKLDNKFDVYAGVTLAYNHFSYNYPTELKNYDGGSSSGVGFAGQIGGRYFFNKKIAVNLEFGGGNVSTGGKLGITYVIN